MHLISHQSIVTDRSLLKYPEVFGSLDRGCSLTKLLYVRSLHDQLEKVSLEMAVFGNLDFDKALDWLVARAVEEGAFKAEGRKFHVTGVGGEKYRSLIQEKLGIEVLFVDEFVCQQTGAHFFLSNFEDEQFCYPEGTKPVKKNDQIPEWIKGIIKRTDELFAETDGKRLPVLFGFCGSATGFNKLNEDGSSEILGGSWFAGKSFLGLSQLLLGTNNYDEIMELAAKGDRRGVDTQAKEMMTQDDDNGEYRIFAPDTPLFPFGKASEGKVGSFSREDLASGIVGSLMCNLLPQIVSHTKSIRVRRVFLGGHFFRAKVARDILVEMVDTLPSTRHLEIKFLSNGHTGCVGAIQVTPEDAPVWRSKPNMNQAKQQ